MPVSAQGKQQDRNYRRLIIRPLCLQLPQTHHSNPHSTTDFLNLVADSRGFLP